MRRLLRIRLATLMVIVLGVAGASAYAPRLWWRHQFKQALTRAINLGQEWESPDGAIASCRLTDYAYLSSDPDRTSQALLDALATDLAIDQKRNALQTMRTLLTRSASPRWTAVGPRCLGQLVALLSQDSADSPVEREILITLADCIPRIGLIQEDRAALLRIAGAKQTLTPEWAKVLIAIGGRDETMLVLSQGGTHDQELLAAIHESPLIRCKWPGILSFLRQWLDDPVVAESRVWDYEILTLNESGRKLLAEYATEPSNPMRLRRRAVDKLTGTLAGVELLLESAQAPDRWQVLTETLQEDCVAVLEARRASLQQANTHDLWSELIEGTDVSHWDPNAGRGAPQVDGVFMGARSTSVKLSLKLLRLLAPTEEYTTKGQWQFWYSHQDPRNVQQGELVQLVLDHPDLLGLPTVARRIVPYHLGTIPADCMPLYKRMVREGPDASRFWGCYALLSLTTDLEAVPFAIQLIAESPRPSAATLLLKERFAVNFFADVAAWETWWNELCAGGTEKHLESNSQPEQGIDRGKTGEKAK